MSFIEGYNPDPNEKEDEDENKADEDPQDRGDFEPNGAPVPGLTSKE